MSKLFGAFCVVLLLILIVLGVIINFRIKPNTATMIKGTLTSLGEKRSYLLFVPDSYNPASPVPLVITLHGYSGEPKSVAAISGWNDLANEEGFIVVYPQGSGNPAYWHSYGGDYAVLNSEVDIQFISNLIDQLEAEYNIDPNRIYINGISMGGGMAYVVACRMADQIAVIGGVAGAYSMPSNLCHPSRPVPLIAFHGTDDLVVPYEGEKFPEYGFAYPTIPQFVKEWADLNQCGRSISTPQEGEISSTTYTQCKQNAEVILYSIHGGGHTWPGNPLGTRADLDATTQQIDATRLMWEFFKLHPMPQE